MSKDVFLNGNIEDEIKLLAVCLSIGGNFIGNDLFYSIISGTEYDLLCVNGLDSFISKSEFNTMKCQILKTVKWKKHYLKDSA